MPHPRLPPEISNYIADFLHDKPGTLKQCCLVSKTWIPRTRKHLFGRINFKQPAEVDAWKKIFPDPANSPGFHTYSLSIRCAEVFTIADVEEGGWMQAFFNVVRLDVSNANGTTFSSSNFLPLICSLPVLEDLHVGYLYPGSSDEVGNTTFRPSISPPLTGTLGLALIMSDAIGCTVKRLMVLPIRFRRLEYFWWREEELPWIMSLVKACFDTLESLGVTDGTWDHSSEALIDLSKAIKLKDVTLKYQGLSVKWVASILKTITSSHRNLREVSIQGRALSDSHKWPTNAAAVGDDIRGLWVGLERTLIQLWESYAVRAKVKYYSMRREESREFMGSLFPEATKRGIVELVDISDVY